MRLLLIAKINSTFMEKNTVRPGRKMGHVTRLLPLSPDWHNPDIELAMSL